MNWVPIFMGKIHMNEEMGLDPYDPFPSGRLLSKTF